MSEDRFYGDMRAMLAQFVDLYESLEAEGLTPIERRPRAAAALGTSPERLAAFEDATSHLFFDWYVSGGLKAGAAPPKKGEDA